MVSAAKLKLAQDAVIQIRPYANKFNEILSNVSSSLDNSDNKLMTKKEGNNILIVALASNRGLCGGFNSSIIKQVKKISENNSSGKVSVLPIGKKINDVIKKTDLIASNEELPNNNELLWEKLSYEKIVPVAENLIERFEKGDYDKIILVYNSFKNAAIQIVIKDQFLPVVPNEDVKESSSSMDYIFEPNQHEIITNLIPQSLKVKLYKAMLESLASEHGARMTAMHKATDNATEMKKELLLFYNKARQASITNEILEIVGGAEALNG